MAWPEKLTDIVSNLNTTEIWALQQQMDKGDYVCEHVTGFAEYREFDVLINGARYHFEESFEVIQGIRLRKENDND